MVMLCAAGVFLAVAGYDVFIGARGTERLVALFGAVATCVLVAIVFLERAWFQFAPNNRTITWRRRWALRQRSGSTSRIRAVLGHGADATHMSNVRALIAAGKAIDAIRVVREEEGLSLLEAKRRVDKIAARAGGSVGRSSGDLP